MSEPTRAGAQVSAELAARRERQRQRGNAAREREFDERGRYDQACRGECAASGSLRGGVLQGDGSLSAGMVVVDRHGDPLAEPPWSWSVAEVFTRPCFDCNRERWEAWQLGQLADKRRRKPETPEDRKATEEKRRRHREQSFD